MVGILLKVAVERPASDSRPGPGTSVPKPGRFDHKGHYPQECPEGNSSCAAEVRGWNA